MKKLLLILLLLPLGCTTVPVNEPSVNPQESTTVSDTETMSVDWLDIAENSDNIELFISSVAQLFAYQSHREYQSIVDLDPIIQEHFLNKLPASTDTDNLIEKFVQFTEVLGGVCPSPTDYYWELISQEVHNPKQASLYFRLSNDESMQWCRVKAEETEAGFRLTNFHNTYYDLGLDDVYRDFITLLNNPDVQFIGNRKQGLGFYQAVNKGSSVFYDYLIRVGVDPTLPVFKRTHIALLESEFIETELFDALGIWFNPHEIRSHNAFIQLFANLYAGSDDQTIRASVNNAIAETGDRSSPLLSVSSLYLKQGKTDLAKQYLTEAIIAEPDNEEAYWTFFDMSLNERTHETTVGVLDILETKFGYEFSRQDFSVNDSTEPFLSSVEFEQWIDE
jgi:hypothetical protein